MNGHGGNDAGRSAGEAVEAEHDDARVLWHNWWSAARTWEVVQQIDPEASHASWSENFPWTRLDGVVQPDERKPMQDIARMRELDPDDVRAMLGDGSLGGVACPAGDTVLLRQSAKRVAEEDSLDAAVDHDPPAHAP